MMGLCEVQGYSSSFSGTAAARRRLGGQICEVRDGIGKHVDRKGEVRGEKYYARHETE